MKLKTTHAMALCVLTLLATQSAWAFKPLQTATLTVTGTIKAGSCSINLEDVTNFDYKGINKDIITDNEKGNALPTAASIPFEITCDSATQVAMNLKDNRATSRVDNITVLSPAEDRPVTSSNGFTYGLGTSNQKNIGAYLVEVMSPKVDNTVTKVSTVRMNNPIASETGPSEFLYPNSPEQDIGFSWFLDGKDAPAIGKEFTGNLAVRASINRSSQLDMSSDIKLDGNATLTIYSL